MGDNKENTFAAHKARAAGRMGDSVCGLHEGAPRNINAQAYSL